MGWTDSHLHQFEKDGKYWGVPEWDEFNELNLIDESKTQLAKVLKSEGDSMIYEYDFGDCWRHEVFRKDRIGRVRREASGLSWRRAAVSTGRCGRRFGL